MTSGSPPSAGARRTLVLFVDDEPLMRAAARRMMERRGCEALLAEDGAQALALLETHGAAVQGVVLDIGLPGVSGWEVLAELRARWPALRVVVASGQDLDEAREASAGAPPDGWLQKPFSVTEFEAALASFGLGEGSGPCPSASRPTAADEAAA